MGQPNGATTSSYHQSQMTVCLCLNTTWIKQALFRPINSGPMVSDIFPKLMHHMTLIDTTSVFGITDAISIVGYDAENRDHNRTLSSVMWIHHQENLKLKNKCNFRCIMVPIFGKIVFRCEEHPDPQKICVLTDMPPTNRLRLY